MKITKKRLKQIIREELASIAEAPIAYKAGAAPEERYRGYESPEEVGLPSRQKRQLDPDLLLSPEAKEQIAQGEKAAEDRARRVKHKSTLADQLDHADHMLRKMDQYWKSNYGQMGPEAAADFKDTRKRWEMKKTQIENIMRDKGRRELVNPMLGPGGEAVPSEEW